MSAARGSNPVGPTRGQVRQARDLFQDFRGHKGTLKRARINPAPKTGLVIGQLDGVLYTTVRDGKTERYIHEFNSKSRPLLVSSHDGQSIHILGGRYEMTNRGIVG